MPCEAVAPSSPDNFTYYVEGHSKYFYVVLSTSRGTQLFKLPGDHAPEAGSGAHVFKPGTINETQERLPASGATTTPQNISCPPTCPTLPTHLFQLPHLVPCLSELTHPSDTTALNPPLPPHAAPPTPLPPDPPPGPNPHLHPPTPQAPILTPTPPPPFDSTWHLLRCSITAKLLPSAGHAEEKRFNGSGGIGPWRLNKGISIRIKGQKYVALLHLQKPNDYYGQGCPQDLHLIWCPKVPKDRRDQTPKDKTPKETAKCQAQTRHQKTRKTRHNT